ncbi:flagellar assembly peptidoglycan hydrolase FlgJ [Variovorax sp.]|uniref:flagellar assembly peptidoglycan hydrolase FlgJ n=1 Tax=Variovorax sp. TaxID=1871043 RepID=UPI002D3A86F9|nr:flagellar assembly peptidoglycan hydrolase FlgJ [Variovorax sp.]HYP85637.1 flagellar assembly peptidoglycan hydrolase FlgJ [Variovorax sp.]
MTSATLSSRAAADARTGALDQRFALDVQGVDALRRTVHASPQEGLRQVSRQFEAMFMNMVIKSMREAVPQSGLFDSQSQRIYTSMLDQQLAQNLSGRGVGLAEAMLVQLQRQVSSGATDMDVDPAPATAYVPSARDALASPSAGVPRSAAPSRMARVDLSVYQANADREESSAATASLQNHVDRFVQRMGASAEAASNATGVPAPLILAQAALESGWGKREIRGDDGTQSHNLFGIKADKSWRGPSVEVWTTEYVDGEPQRVRAKFRAYGSYEEAFTDYARFLTRNPRYAGVLDTDDAAEAAHGLQRAGYATDPQYGRKLVQIMRQLG